MLSTRIPHFLVVVLVALLALNSYTVDANPMRLERRQNPSPTPSTTSGGGPTATASNSTEGSSPTPTIDPNDGSVIDGGKNSSGGAGRPGEPASVNWVFPSIIQRKSQDYPVIAAGGDTPFIIQFNLTNVRVQPKSLTLEYKRNSDKADAWVKIDDKVPPSTTNYSWSVPGNVSESRDYVLRLYDTGIGPNDVKQGAVRATISGRFFVYKPRDLSIPIELPNDAAKVFGSIGWTLLFGLMVGVVGLL